jgi:prevent-host-death family protein
MAWSVAEAKQRLSELLRNAAKEPQTIENRSRPVAVVVAAEAFQEFETWRVQRKARSVGEAFAELRSLTAGTGYELDLPRRKDRRDGFSRPAR